ncbi:GNAT family N-acetyltransferase [Vagococcus sp. BWB3-3]|uniref:GNAT family N-acetyltransferase n=1 Tax=Vagococcus allomyrinae TaxID=2794353 RepID=A0A940STF2_9ENTE|nr:GNAT family protein [Vagococcus allomyrinae]MBP1043062.1 GNAT family N-acetyltransferase [Vagococcus allomyrinae]
MNESQPDFTTKPRLASQSILLRPFEMADSDALLAILAEPEVNRLTGSVGTSAEAQRQLSADEVKRIRHWYESRNQQTDRLDLVIYSQEQQAVVGEVVINEWDANSNSANYRILIGEKGRNQGIGQTATALLVAYAFEYLKLNRLELEVFSFNPRARHVYQKSGFVYEGTRREAFKFDDQWVDSECYAMLASDYLKLK